MMMFEHADRVVTLSTGGSTVSTLVWLIEAERRGLRVYLPADNPGRIKLGPHSRLTDRDLEFARRRKPELLAALRYLAAARPC